MDAINNLVDQMAEKSNEELSAMFQEPENWQPEALEIAKAELARRGIDTSTISAVPPPIPDGQPVFFPVSPLKLILMSTITFGIYELYWFYKNWKCIKRRKGGNTMPFWRALFGVLFCYSCFNEIKQTAKLRGIPIAWSPGWLAFLWIILALDWRLPDPFWLISCLSPFVLLPIQKTVNHLNAAVVPSHDPNSRFSAWNTVGVILGGLLFVLCIIAMFLPK